MFDFLFTQHQPNFFWGLIFGLFAGIIIGVERELRGKAAGISTNSMVIIGSMLFTFLSATTDPESKTRIAAQVVTGIGFLGAGLIIRDGGNVKNLTTAASVWFAAAIGMALGFGYYGIGLLTAVMGVILPRIPQVKMR